MLERFYAPLPAAPRGVSEAGGASRPTPRDQLASLPFAVLLLDADRASPQANPAAEQFCSAQSAPAGRAAARRRARLRRAAIARPRSAQRGRAARSRATLAIAGRRHGALAGQPDGLAARRASGLAGGDAVTTPARASARRARQRRRRGRLRAPAMLAHEIKNPLAGIRGAAQLLARKLDDGATAR